MARRTFLRHGCMAAAAALALPAAPAWAAGLGRSPRELAFNNLHTNERIDIVYSFGGHLIPNALDDLNHFLRDHYSGEVGNMDPQLFDQLYALQNTLGVFIPFDVISGYRSPVTNETLRSTRGGGVARNSLHMNGQAIDMRLPGVPLEELRDAAVSLRAGGVGYYPRSNFVHIDTGVVRTWGWKKDQA